MRKKRLCSHGDLLFLPDINLSSVKVENQTKDSVHTTLSLFLSVYWPKAYQLGIRKKRLCSHGLLLFLPDINLSSVKVDNRTKDSVHTTLSFFLSVCRPKAYQVGIGKKRLSFTLGTTTSAGHRPIKCQKQNCVHKEDYSFCWSWAYQMLTWTTEIRLCSHRRLLFLSFFLFLYWPKTYQVDIGKRLLSHGRLLFLLTITAMRCLR